LSLETLAQLLFAVSNLKLLACLSYVTVAEVPFVVPNNAVAALLSFWPMTISKPLSAFCATVIMKNECYRAAAYVCCSIALPRDDVVEVCELII